MSKRIQVLLNDEAQAKLEKVHKQVSQDFKTGVITLGDVVSEMIIASDIDIKELRIKHTDAKKTLLDLADQPEIDLDLAIKTLQELKTKSTHRSLMKKPLKASKVVQAQAEDKHEL